MIKIRHMLAIFFLVLLGYGLWVAHYLGAFKEVEFAVQKAGPFHMVYREHVGAYHKIVPVIETVETWAKAHSLSCHLTFGQYLDNPSTVDEDRLHSRGGCLVENLPTLNQEDVNASFKTETLPTTDYLVAHFKGSPGIGPLKVYPKANDYMAHHQWRPAGPVMEVYEIKSSSEMETTYYFPIQKSVNDVSGTKCKACSGVKFFSQRFQRLCFQSAAKARSTHIKSRGDEKMEKNKNPNKKARCWVVERTHSWFNRFRRLLVRWEKKAPTMRPASILYQLSLHSRLPKFSDRLLARAGVSVAVIQELLGHAEIKTSGYAAADCATR